MAIRNSIFSWWTFSWAKFKSFRIFDVMTINEVISSRLTCLFEKRLWFLMSVTCVQCEPAFICEWGPSVDLPVLLFFGKLSWADARGVWFFLQFDQKLAQVGHSQGLCSSSNKGAVISPAAALMPLCNPVQLFLCSSPSPICPPLSCAETETVNHLVMAY